MGYWQLITLTEKGRTVAATAGARWARQMAALTAARATIGVRIAVFTPGVVDDGGFILGMPPAAQAAEIG